MKKSVIPMLLLLNIFVILLHMIWKEKLLTISLLENICQEAEAKLLALENKIVNLEHAKDLIV